MACVVAVIHIGADAVAENGELFALQRGAERGILRKLRFGAVQRGEMLRVSARLRRVDRDGKHFVRGGLGRCRRDLDCEQVVRRIRALEIVKKDCIVLARKRKRLVLANRDIHIQRDPFVDRARIAAVQLLQRELERIAFHDRRGLLAAPSSPLSNRVHFHLRKI